jgi:hypothetical protein
MANKTQAYVSTTDEQQCLKIAWALSLYPIKSAGGEKEWCLKRTGKKRKNGKKKRKIGKRKNGDSCLAASTYVLFLYV